MSKPYIVTVIEGLGPESALEYTGIPNISNSIIFIIINNFFIGMSFKLKCVIYTKVPPNALTHIQDKPLSNDMAGVL